ncbi:hypothetical protein [Vibrio penaeicida]|uniref:hypothetical protein n=1 Tax=Vibrio penaeicida TaxID=104609 RepID=UPI000CE9FC64|nr:hypothetical protein [Vibrio penaeicida]
MLNDLSSELSKLNKSITKANTLLSYATKLRPTHISSKSKINDLFYDDLSREDTHSYLLRSKPVTIQLKEQRFVAKLEITLFDRKPIKLSYIDTFGKKHEKVSRKFYTTEAEGIYAMVFNISAPIKEVAISTVTGEVSLKKW